MDFSLIFMAANFHGRYVISSNKRWISNKCCPLIRPHHWYSPASNKRLPVISATPQMTAVNRNLLITKSKYIWSKHITYEKLKIISSFGIYKVVYLNDSSWLLTEKRKLVSFKISCEYFIWPWNKRLPLLSAAFQ